MNHENTVIVPHATLREAQHAIMQEVGYVQKQRSDQLGFTILTEQAVIAATREFFLKHGVLMVPLKTSVHSHADYVTSRGTRMVNAVVTRTFRFLHLHSDDFSDVEVAGEGMDTSDKSIAKSLTACKKQAIREWLLLETGNDPDVVVANREAENFDYFRRACNGLLACHSKEELDNLLPKVLAAKSAEWTDSQVTDLTDCAKKRLAELSNPKQGSPSRKPAEAL